MGNTWHISDPTVEKKTKQKSLSHYSLFLFSVTIASLFLLFSASTTSPIPHHKQQITHPQKHQKSKAPLWWPNSMATIASLLFSFSFSLSFVSCFSHLILFFIFFKVLAMVAILLIYFFQDPNPFFHPHHDFLSSLSHGFRK
jgi:hypothetical protein